MNEIQEAILAVNNQVRDLIQQAYAEHGMTPAYPVTKRLLRAMSELDLARIEAGRMSQKQEATLG